MVFTEASRPAETSCTQACVWFASEIKLGPALSKAYELEALRNGRFETLRCFCGGRWGGARSPQNAWSGRIGRLSGFGFTRGHVEQLRHLLESCWYAFGDIVRACFGFTAKTLSLLVVALGVRLICSEGSAQTM